MASPMHYIDPSLLTIRVPKAPRVDKSQVLGLNLTKRETGSSGPLGAPDTRLLALNCDTSPRPDNGHCRNGTGLDSAVVDSTREETPGIDITNLPRTPLGTTPAIARTDDLLNLNLSLGPATTATGLVQSLALADAKEELCMSSAEWLRFQQEIIKFLDQGEWLYHSYHEAAYAFLEGTDANERFFGLLPGGEAEGLLINRGGLAWDLDNDRIIELAATVIEAWKEAPVRSEDDSKENTERIRISPITTHRHVSGTEQQHSQLMPEVIAMLPKDVLDECMTAFPVKSTQKCANSSDGDEDDGGSVLFLTQQRTSVKRKRRVIESENEADDDGNKESQELQPISESNKRRRSAMGTRKSSITAGTTAPTRNPGPQMFINRAWPTLIGDTITGPQMWTSPKPPQPAPWMPSTLHIHGAQRGPMKLLTFTSILTLDGLLYQFRNAFRKEISSSTVTNKCQAVRRFRVYHKLLFDASGSRIEGDNAHLWKETMEKMRKKIGGKDIGRIAGSVEVHF